MKTCIIINADDFGYSPGVNRGIIEAIQKGVVTSCSIDVTAKYADQAKVLANNNEISLGLHLTLTTEGLRVIGEIIKMRYWSKTRIEKELQKQIDLFEQIVGRKPDHIDSHHHIHRMTRFKSVVERYAKSKDIRVRAVDAKFIYWRYKKKSLSDLINNLDGGMYEILCHPGYIDKELIETGTRYLFEREEEVKILTSTNIKKDIERNSDVELVSWNDL